VVFYVVTPCRVGYERFDGSCCFHLQHEDEGTFYSITTWRNNPQDYDKNLDRHENLIFCTEVTVFNLSAYHM